MNILFKHLLGSVSFVNVHYVRPVFKKRKSINTPTQAVELIRSICDPDALCLKEYSWVILLSKENHLIGVSQICVGDFNSVMIDVREIAQLALLTNASSIVLAHSHTSEYDRPSESDIQITKRIKNGLALLDVATQDHIILTHSSFFSFRNNEMI